MRRIYREFQLMLYANPDLAAILGVIGGALLGMGLGIIIGLALSAAGIQ